MTSAQNRLRIPITDFDEFVANGSKFFESGERGIALGMWTLQDGLRSGCRSVPIPFSLLTP